MTGLFAVSIRQALFIAPCSHTFHYKCIKPLIEAHHPAFSCPLCRTYADLDEDVEVEPTDLDADADTDANADVEIDEGPSSVVNNRESDAANQSDNVATAASTPSRPIDSAQYRHAEDAEMSDGSFNAAPSRPALTPLPHIPVTSGRPLIGIAKRVERQKSSQTLWDSCPCLLDGLEEQEPEERRMRENARGTFPLCCPVVGHVRRMKGHRGRVIVTGWMKLTKSRWVMR